MTKIIEVKGCHDCPYNKLEEFVDPVWTASCGYLNITNLITDDDDFILDNCPLEDKIEENQGNMTRRYETCPRCQNKKIIGTMCFRCLHKEHLKSLERSKNR